MREETASTLLLIALTVTLLVWLGHAGLVAFDHVLASYAAALP